MARALACVAALALACAAPAADRDAGRAPAASAAPALRLLVAPLNLAIAFPEGLEDARLPVETQLLRALATPGRRVTRIAPGDAWLLWRRAAAGVSTEGDAPQRLAAVTRGFVAALREAGAEFDALLLPALAHRTARMTGGVAHWDGVKRRLQVEVRDPANAAAYAPTWREVPALSLHLTAVDAAGRVVHEGWGGLDLVYAAVIDGDVHDTGPALSLRRDILADPALVQEGIAVALRGFDPGS